MQAVRSLMNAARWSAGSAKSLRVHVEVRLGIDGELGEEVLRDPGTRRRTSRPRSPPARPAPPAAAPGSSAAGRTRWPWRSARSSATRCPRPRSPCSVVTTERSDANRNSASATLSVVSTVRRLCRVRFAQTSGKNFTPSALPYRGAAPSPALPTDGPVSLCEQPPAGELAPSCANRVVRERVELRREDVREPGEGGSTLESEVGLRLLAARWPDRSGSREHVEHAGDPRHPRPVPVLEALPERRLAVAVDQDRIHPHPAGAGELVVFAPSPTNTASAGSTPSSSQQRR